MLGAGQPAGLRTEPERRGVRTDHGCLEGRRVDGGRGHEAPHERKRLVPLERVSEGEHSGSPLVVETLDQVATDHYRVLDPAGPVPADLAVVGADLEIVIEHGRHADRTKGVHGRLEQHAQRLAAGGRHCPCRQADLEEQLVRVQVDRTATHHSPQEGEPVIEAVVAVHLVDPPVVAEAHIRGVGASERESRRFTGGHPIRDRMPEGLRAQR